MVHFYLRIITFIIGVCLGVLLAVIFKNHINNNTQIFEKNRNPFCNRWFEKQELQRQLISWDKLKYEKHNYFLESQYLFHKIKVLCVVLVHRSKNVNAIENTWGKGCNSIKYVNILKNNKVPGKRKKEHSSWVLLCNTLQKVDYGYHWTVIVNDNTFVILENVRYFVAKLNASETHYLGHAVTFWNTVYNSGEAGYLLSNGSLQILKNKFNETGCSTNTYWNKEDFYLGKHMSSLNITPVDTRDKQGLSTFHPYNWYHVFYPGENYYKTSIFPVKCCSKYSVTFQAIEGDKMYTYYYLLYTLQIFLEGTKGNRSPAKTVPDEQVWKQFLKERNILDVNISSAQYYKLWEDLVDDPTSFAYHMKKESDFNNYD